MGIVWDPESLKNSKTTPVWHFFNITWDPESKTQKSTPSLNKSINSIDRCFLEVFFAWPSFCSSKVSVCLGRSVGLLQVVVALGLQIDAVVCKIV